MPGIVKTCSHCSKPIGSSSYRCPWCGEKLSVGFFQLISALWAGKNLKSTHQIIKLPAYQPETPIARVGGLTIKQTNCLHDAYNGRFVLRQIDLKHEWAYEINPRAAVHHEKTINTLESRRLLKREANGAYTCTDLGNFTVDQQLR